MQKPELDTPDAAPAGSRRRARKVLSLLVALSWGLALPAWSASDTPAQPDAPKGSEQPIIQPAHSLGDQMLQISAGGLIPLFFQSLTGEVKPTRLTMGGTGSLEWNAYVSKDIRIGLEVGGMFAFSRQKNTLVMVPITAQAAYVLSLYPFEFPISVGLGMNVVKYVEDVYIDPILMPGIGALWQFDVSWSFGLKLAYWWVPHVSAKTPDDTRFGNFLSITLSALYNF
jgi:hypothetical protein